MAGQHAVAGRQRGTAVRAGGGGGGGGGGGCGRAGGRARTRACACMGARAERAQRKRWGGAPARAPGHMRRAGRSGPHAAVAQPRRFRCSAARARRRGHSPQTARAVECGMPRRDARAPSTARWHAARRAQPRRLAAELTVFVAAQVVRAELDLADDELLLVCGARSVRNGGGECAVRRSPVIVRGGRQAGSAHWGAGSARGSRRDRP
jgi:hypothetical protein